LLREFGLKMPTAKGAIMHAMQGRMVAKSVWQV
jgi:hypothetical protein